MALLEKAKFSQIRSASRPVPEGFVEHAGVQMEWACSIVLNLNYQYDALILQKGDKRVSIPWTDVAKRLGLDW